MRKVKDRQFMTLLATLTSSVDLGTLDADKVQRAIRDPMLFGKGVVDLINSASWISQEKPALVDVPFWRKVSDTEIEVSLNPCELPREEVNVLPTCAFGGKVRLELREDGELYRDGEKVCLAGYVPNPFEEEHEDRIPTLGCDAKGRFLKSRVLHPNEMSALEENQHLIPHSWRDDSNDMHRTICFFAVEFSSHHGYKSVLGISWQGMKWISVQVWMHTYWPDNHYAAVVAVG